MTKVAAIFIVMLMTFILVGLAIHFQDKKDWLAVIFAALYFGCLFVLALLML